MRQTVSFRASRRGRAALGRRACVVALTAAWWGVSASPAAAPAPWPELAPRPLSLHDELTRALADRAGHVAGVSRSQPAEAPPPPPVVWPAQGILTGWFGERRGGHSHPGIDVDGDTGDPVVAAAAGTVSHAGPAPAGYSGYGTIVMVAHDDGLVSIYAHLSAVAVRAGQAVAPGDRLGAVGTTGNVTGSHLHFELRQGGTIVDPRRWLPPR